MTKQRKIKANLGDHWAIVGGTGSGKTTLAKQLLLQYAIATKGQMEIFIIDSKMAGDFDQFTKNGWGHAYFGNAMPPTENPDGTPFVVWQPEYDDKDNYDIFFEMIYRRRQPCLVFIDELASISHNQYPPRGYDKLLKMGRGLGISVVTLTQTARLVPLSLLSQVMHVIKMNVNSDKDSKKLVDVLGKFALEPIRHTHGFFYRNVTKPIRTHKAEYYEDFTEFFGIDK